MKTEHAGIEIEYNEKDEKFECVIRDRHRIFDSLKKAKEAIDKEPAEKRKKMEPIAVLRGSELGYGKVYPGKITSFTDGWGNKTFAWVAWDDPHAYQKREKQDCNNIYLDTPEAREAAKAIAGVLEKAKVLEEEAAAIRRALPIPKPSEAV